MRIKIIKKNIKHLNDKIIDATGDRFVDVSVSSGDRLVIEAQGQTTVITANANQLAQGAIENSQGLQFKRLNFDLLVGNGETTYVRISRFYLMSDVQLESVSWNGQLLNDTFVGQLNTWQYGSMVAESPISVSDPGAFVGVSNVSDTVAMGSATTTQVASVGGFSPIGWVASVPATAAGAGISMTGAAVVGGGALLASAAAKGKSSDSSSSTPDTASPTFVSATTSTDGKKIILTYSEDLGETTAKADAFTVKVGSTEVAINSVAVVGKTIELTMSTAIKKGDAITFAYQAPASDASTTNTAIQDKTGNDAASQKETVVNNALNGVVPAPTLALNKDSGSSNTDGITNDGKVNVTGVESGATWQYSSDGGSTWTTGSGTSFTLAAGKYLANAVQVRQTDAAGNVSDPTGKIASEVTVDTAAPSAPTAALNKDSGSSNTDGITNDGKVNVTGVESSATWEYSTNSGSTWTTGSGTSFTLAAGKYLANAVQVRQTDAAGNVSDPTGKIASEVTVDTAAPSAPTAALNKDSGSSNTDGITNDGKVNVTGVESSATWEYSTNSGSTWTTGSGTSFTLAAGKYLANAVQVRQTDAAGNVSDPTGKIASEVTVGTAAPSAPTAALNKDSGSSNTDGITNDGKVNVTGVESSAAWQYSSDGGSTWTTGSGTSFTLAAGKYLANAVQVRQTDAAGNVSDPTGKIASAVTVDTTAPAFTSGGTASTPINTATTTVVYDANATDAGGTADVGITYTLSDTDAALFNIASNGGGVTFKDSPREAGTKSFTVTATDAAGNTSTQVVTLTIAAGPTTTVSSAKFSNDTGSSSSDFITSNASQTISGSLSAAITAGQSVWVSLDNGVNWVQATTTVNQSTWSLSNQTLKSDSNTLMVQVRDSLGNKGTTYSQAYTLDTTAPSALSVGLKEDTGSSTPDGYTFNPQVDISGKETGATWQYSTNSGKSWTNGSDTVDSFNLAEGSYLSSKGTSVLVRQVDKAGNVSDPTNLGGVVIDTTAPTLTTAATSTDGTQIVLTYNEDLLSTNPAAPTDFTVTVQDFTGNDAATLAPTAVTNNSTSSSGPSLASVQKLDNVTNLDVRSALVIAFDSAISLNSGKIKIFDDMGNSGWTHTNQSTVDSRHPELTQSIQDKSDNDIEITLANGVVTAIRIGGVDQTSRFDLAKSVTVNGNNQVIDLTQKTASGPGYSDGTVIGTVKTSFDQSTSDLEHTAFDWDFGSNYHVEFEAGIVKNANNKTNAALSDSTTLNFTTVTPSIGTTATASQIMDSTGASTTLSAGKRWVSGNQNQVSGAAQVIDMNQGDVAVVIDSMGESTRGTNLAGNVQLNNFDTDDLIYIDNHGDMSMITTDGLAVGNPATWSNTTRTLNNPSGSTSVLHVYKDAGDTGVNVVGDQFLDSTLLDSNSKSQNIVIFG